MSSVQLGGSALWVCPADSTGTAAGPVPELGAQLVELGTVGSADGPTGGPGLLPHLRARLREGRARSREGKSPGLRPVLVPCHGP